MTRAPSAAERHAALAAWLIALGGSVAIILLILAPPVLRLWSPRLSALLYAVFAPLCHQEPARCFSLGGFPMAVCGRCLGIYLGFAVGALAYPFLRGFSRPCLPAVRTFFLASFPIALDVAGNVTGFWTSPIGFRFVTGLFWGAFMPAYVIAGFYDLIAGLPGFRSQPEDPA